MCVCRGGCDNDEDNIVTRAFNLEGTLVVRIILPGEVDLTVGLDRRDKVGRCRRYIQGNGNGIGITRAASGVKRRHPVIIRRRGYHSRIRIGGHIRSDSSDVGKCLVVGRTLDIEPCFIIRLICPR